MSYINRNHARQTGTNRTTQVEISNVFWLSFPGRVIPSPLAREFLNLAFFTKCLPSVHRLLNYKPKYRRLGVNCNAKLKRTYRKMPSSVLTQRKPARSL